MKYTFYKEEDNRWYVDLPKYIKEGGEKADLEMVLGADELLDMLSNGQDRVTISLSEEEVPCRATLTLVKKYEDGDGADYTAEVGDKKFDCWLCNVMIYVFTYYPKKIYIV